jgi:nucleoside-diphosphate-sugar epimerase
MRILIAGCGYVGSELARRLLADGHTVFGLRRNTSLLPEGVLPVPADLSRPETLLVLPGNLDAVVYAASADGYSAEAYRAAYVTGLDHLLGALDGADAPRRLLYVSSTGVYGQNDGEWLDEDSPALADRPTAQALRDGEALALSAPCQAIVVRFSGIYGPGRTRLIDSVAAGSARLEPGDTRYLNHIHRDDCAGSLAHLLSVADPAPCYLATDSEPRPRNDLLCWIAREIGLPDPPMDEAPESITRPSERGGNRRYRNQRLLDSGYVFRYPTFREGYGALLRHR